jgi:hypothetical protein
MNRLLSSLVIGLSVSLGAVLAQTDSTQAQGALHQAFGACGEPCIVRYNPGGELQLYQAAAREVMRGARRLVVIDGPCISACAIFADMARERVCITDRAQFGFHKARRYAVHPLANGRTRAREVARRDPPHSQDIAQWVRSRGGFPNEGLRMMSARDATRFWRRCSVRGT